MLVEHGKDFIAEFLIEPRGLKTEGRRLSADSLAGALPALHLQSRADTLPSQVLMHPYRTDVTTRTPGPTFEPCIDGLLGIPEKLLTTVRRQPLFFPRYIRRGGLPKPDIVKSRIGFNTEVLLVHHAAFFFHVPSREI